MTLDEGIRFCEAIARRRSDSDEHRQLADWLKILKIILDSGNCNTCAIRKHCNVVPELGKMVRYNCPMFVRKEED